MILDIVIILLIDGVAGEYTLSSGAVRGGQGIGHADFLSGTAGSPDLLRR